MKRAILAVVVASLIAQHGSATVHAQVTGNAFQFFQNYFITGDYAVGGVGLRGSGIGTIEILEDIPPTADILGAFLYWQSVVSTGTLTSASDGVTFEGEDIGGVEGAAGTIAVRVNGNGTTPCWAAGGATGSANGSKVLAMFRADVMRFLDEDDIDPATGKLAIDKADRLDAGLSSGFDVVVPDGTSGNGLPLALGASLVILYREPGMPLRSIVMYDGAHTLDQGSTTFSLTLQGFYQAGATPNARVTPIVGDGQPNFSERLVIGTGLGSGIFMNPFTGEELGEDWDNPTFDAADFTLSAGASSLPLLIDKEGLSSFDCLSIGAVVMSTEVQDNDQDGLVDLLEDQNPPPADPNGAALPNLKAMGAGSDKRDVFFEIGFHTTTGYTEPLGQGIVPAHNHLPDAAAITMVGDALKNAPAKGTIPAGIRAHFDVGNNYQTNAYVIPWSGGPNNLARGGESFPETDCVPSVTQDCDFPNFRGTVGWKTGYRTLRDQVFDDNRHHSFRYVLFAHALGLRRSEFACLSGTTPVPGDANDNCPEGTTPNPAFSSPSKTSGIADPPGGDAMVTLGFWDNFRGTTFMQAATLLHEFGHLGLLRHGGVPTVENNALVFQPNCKPNYLSVMNYMFQTRGVICDGSATAALAPACVNAQGVANKAGQPVIDFSRQVLGGLNEASLNEANGLGMMAYRTRWYALNSPLDANIGTTASTKHCDGSLLNTAANEPGLFRIEGTSALGPIDWNNDGLIANSAEDITFSGDTYKVPPQLPQNLAPGSNDWANLDLRHVASRRNVEGLSLQMEDEDLSPGDPSTGDLGKGDVGKGDVGKGDVGKGDVGKGDVGKGDVGAPPGDLDLDTARHVGNSPTLAVPVVGKQSITLSWTPPHVDAVYVTRYRVWRSVGATASTTPLLVADLVGVPIPTTFVDTTVKNNTLYTYFVQAEISVPASPVVLTGASNYQTILKK